MNIGNKLLKINATYTCSPLTYICNKTILSGIFPDCLKFSIIQHISRIGDVLKTTNSRPLSLLISFSVFEQALYMRTIKNFYSNKLLVGNKVGFRKGIAT